MGLPVMLEAICANVIIQVCAYRELYVFTTLFMQTLQRLVSHIVL